jgi:hypothetical protein
MSSIEERIDKLLGKDFEKTTTEEIVSIITGGEGINGPYEDLQSDAGFNKELDKSIKEVERLIKSLEPQKPPISLKKIEELSCSHEGDALYAQILLESLKKDDPRLYSELVKSGALDEKTITQEDIGVKSTVQSLNRGKKITSLGITNFLSEENPRFLEKTNERIFDNLDPLLLGKPSNSGSRKKRELNVLGFKIPLEFIMSGKKIAHVKLSGPKITNQQALDKINETLELQYKNSKPCDFDGLNLDSQEDDSDSSNLNNSSGTRSVRIDDYDSNFFPEGDDPILDQDCAPGLPEDPITGDVILTEEAFNEASSDFCDPPAYDFSGLNPDEADPSPPPVDVDAIQSCIDSALDKSNKIDDNNLEEITTKGITHEDVLEELEPIDILVEPTVNEEHEKIEENITLDLDFEDLNEDIEENSDELKEINNTDLSLVNNLDTMQLKKPNQVYFELYKEARKKAKEAKRSAILAYLEAKNIKKTYMLDNLNDSDSEFDAEIDEVSESELEDF